MTSGLSGKAGRTRHDDSITTSPIRNALLHATFALNRAAMHPSRSISATPVAAEFPSPPSPSTAPWLMATTEGRNECFQRVYDLLPWKMLRGNVKAWFPPQMRRVSHLSARFFLLFFFLATLHLPSQLRIVRGTPRYERNMWIFFFFLFLFSHLYLRNF